MAVHNSSAVELNWKPIALRYLRGWACYDLLTAIPWWRVVYNVDVSELTVRLVPAVPRLLRGIGRVARQLNNTMGAPAS